MKIDEKIKAAVPSLSAEEIMSMIPGVEEYAEIEAYTFSSMPSPHMTLETMLKLSKFTTELVEREDIDGVVITHGTDTLEETAYLLDLTVRTKKPVVVTGAMRSGSELGYDGPFNLATSICTAISDEAVGRGVLVCFNGELNSASEVTKANSMALNAFRTPNFGPIGIVDNDNVIFYRDANYSEKYDVFVTALITKNVAIEQYKKSEEVKVGNAEEKARGIIDDALKTAETKKREALLEAKEEAIKTKNEIERESKERRAELQRYEKRVLSKEETLDKKSDALEKKENKLNAKNADLDRQKKELEEIKASHLQELEKISGLTTEQAKEYLLKSVEEDVKHETAVLVKELNKKAKEEADKKAKDYVVTAI